MDKRSDKQQETLAVGLTPVEKSLMVNLRQKRTLLTICEYYQRNAAAAEAEMAIWMDELAETLRSDMADISRMLRLYDLSSADVYAVRSQVDEARYVRSREGRLDLLRGRSYATIRWYQQELGAQPPDDVAALWNAFLASEQERVQQIEQMLTESTNATPAQT